MPPVSDVKSPAPVTGTTADQPLTTPVSEVLGNKLDSLLKSALADEQPEQEPVPPAETEAPKAEEEEKPADQPSEEPPADAEETEDTDLSKEPENTDNSESEEPAEDLPKGVKKRLSKLAAAKRELEARIKELEAKVAQPAPEPAAEVSPVPLPSNPYLHLDTQAKVDAEIAQARRVKRWCEENPDGATVADPKTGKETEYTSEQIRRIKLNAMDALEEHLPKQLAYVQQRAQIDPLAEQTYTWWKDRSSAEYQQAQQMLHVFPELQKFPDWKMVVGDYIAGAKQRETYQKQKAQAQGKPVVKKAPTQPTKPASAPAPVRESDAKAQQADALMRKRPTTESLKKVVLSQFL